MRPGLATAVRVPAAVAVLLLVAALLGVAAPPATAAAPWRFVESADAEPLPTNTITAVTVSCPNGFIPVGGGLASVGGGPGTAEIVSAFRVGAASPVFQVNVHNYNTVSNTATVNAVCADASQVGSLQFESTEIARDATTGIAAGSVTCPSGSKALIGGADWSANGGINRRIDFQGPTVTGQGWQARAWSGAAGATLAVEAYCISDAAIGSAAIASTSTTYGGADNNVTGQVMCPAGRRPGSGGIEAASEAGGPGNDNFLGNDWYSAPSITEPAWNTRSAVQANVTLRRNVWCLPASQPTVTFTQTPPTTTNSSAADFAYTASDPAGESIESTMCQLDSGAVSCGAASATVSGLAAGPHTFSVTVRNGSYQSTTASYGWTVDQTPPQLLTPIAQPAVTGPFRIVFDEHVFNVPAGLTITEVGTATPVQGAFSVLHMGNGQTVVEVSNLDRQLVPGRRYAVTLSSAIEDGAGNAITPVTKQVRAKVLVQNSSPALVQRWDRDTNAGASGGGFIESSAPGSRATWTVTTTDGQPVVVYGVRRPNGGYGTVYVDGVKAKRVSFYKAVTAWSAAVFQTGPLSAGQHTIEVRTDGTKQPASSGTWVGLDALGIDATRVQETSAVQMFRRVSATAASGGSYDTVAHRTGGDTGARPIYQLKFDGVGVNGYVTKTPSSGSADVYVDGVKTSTVNLSSAAVQYGALGFAVSGLAPGEHVLRVLPVGTSSGSQSSVGLDRLVVK